jgi:hypothetical protein
MRRGGFAVARGSALKAGAIQKDEGRQRRQGESFHCREILAIGFNQRYGLDEFLSNLNDRLAFVLCRRGKILIEKNDAPVQAFFWGSSGVKSSPWGPGRRWVYNGICGGNDRWRSLIRHPRPDG